MNDMIWRLVLAVQTLQGTFPVPDDDLEFQRPFLRVAAPFVCQLQSHEQYFYGDLNGDLNTATRPQLQHARFLAQVIKTGPQADEGKLFGMSQEQIIKAIEGNRAYRNILSAEFGKGNKAEWLQKAADENEILHMQLQQLNLAIHQDSNPRLKREVLYNLRETMGTKAYYSRQPPPAIPVWSLNKLGEQ